MHYFVLGEVPLLVAVVVITVVIDGRIDIIAVFSREFNEDDKDDFGEEDDKEEEDGHLTKLDLLCLAWN